MLCQLRPHHPLRQAILFRLFIVCVVEVEQAIMAIMAIECALILSKATQLHSYVQVFDFLRVILVRAQLLHVRLFARCVLLLTCSLVIYLYLCQYVWLFLFPFLLYQVQPLRHRSSS